MTTERPDDNPFADPNSAFNNDVNNNYDQFMNSFNDATGIQGTDFGNGPDNYVGPDSNSTGSVEQPVVTDYTPDSRKTFEYVPPMYNPSQVAGQGYSAQSYNPNMQPPSGLGFNHSPAPVEPPVSMKAIAALVTSLTVPPVGLILAILGLKESKQLKDGPGKTISTISLIFSIIGTFFLVIVLLFVVIFAVASVQG